MRFIGEGTLITRPIHNSQILINLGSYRTQLYEVVERATQLSPQFVSQFTKLYTKFSKVSRKDNFKFTADIVTTRKQQGY
ncbi:BnaC04g56420D [Brassica napus]|uniref:BnaC04g56420D protein n=1 Tax=Brassica napus TaxID=3708 RepID=A0A078JAK9_BRANA|nr:BnaC04g56420D [Brassica napus]